MYSIGEMAKLTGISAFTLRYYEKIGILPKPSRYQGQRSYQEQDLQYIRFIHELKQTGMSLEDIAAFTESGCLLALREEDTEINEPLKKRIQFLAQHMEKLNQKIEQAQSVKRIAEEKSAYYVMVLNRREDA